jgi:hypothetical protein
VVREYVEHYHHERGHQGLDNVIPLPVWDLAKEQSYATNDSAAYWATIGGTPHSAGDRVFDVDELPRSNFTRRAKSVEVMSESSHA